MLVLKAEKRQDKTRWGIFEEGGDFPLVVFNSLKEAKEAYLELNYEEASLEGDVEKAKEIIVSGKLSFDEIASEVSKLGLSVTILRNPRRRLIFLEYDDVVISVYKNGEKVFEYNYHQGKD